MDIAKKLKSLSDVYEAAKPRTGFGGGIEVENTLAKIEGVELKFSKNQNLMCVFSLEVVDGEHTGEEVVKRSMLETESNWEYFKRDCEILGIELPSKRDLDKLPVVLDEFVKDFKNLVTITSKKDDNGNYNVYLNGVSEYTVDDVVPESSDKGAGNKPKKSGKR